MFETAAGTAIATSDTADGYLEHNGNVALHLVLGSGRVEPKLQHGQPVEGAQQYTAVVKAKQEQFGRGCRSPAVQAG